MIFANFGEHREDFDLVPHPDHKNTKNKYDYVLFSTDLATLPGSREAPPGLGEAFQYRFKKQFGKTF